MDEQAARRLGAWIRDAREARNWRQQDLAWHASLSDSWIINLEAGKAGPQGPRVKTLQKLERALDIPTGTLRRVVAGEDVPLTVLGSGHTTDTNTVLDEVIRQLGDVAARLDRLERRVDPQDD